MTLPPSEERQRGDRSTQGAKELPTIPSRGNSLESLRNAYAKLEGELARNERESDASPPVLRGEEIDVNQEARPEVEGTIETAAMQQERELEAQRAEATLVLGFMRLGLSLEYVISNVTTHIIKKVRFMSEPKKLSTLRDLATDFEPYLKLPAAQAVMERIFRPDPAHQPLLTELIELDQASHSLRYRHMCLEELDEEAQAWTDGAETAATKVATLSQQYRKRVESAPNVDAVLDLMINGLGSEDLLRAEGEDKEEVERVRKLAAFLAGEARFLRGKQAAARAIVARGGADVDRQLLELELFIDGSSKRKALADVSQRLDKARNALVQWIEQNPLFDAEEVARLSALEELGKAALVAKVKELGGDTRERV